MKFQMEMQNLGSVEKIKKPYIISTLYTLQLHRSLVDLEMQVGNTSFFFFYFIFYLGMIVTSSWEEWPNSTNCWFYHLVGNILTQKKDTGRQLSPALFTQLCGGDPSAGPELLAPRKLKLLKIVFFISFHLLFIIYNSLYNC